MEVVRIPLVLVQIALKHCAQDIREFHVLGRKRNCGKVYRFLFERKIIIPGIAYSVPEMRYRVAA